MSEEPRPGTAWVGLGRPCGRCSPPGPYPCIALVPRYELGPALYLGWSASLLCILGGICLCCSLCCASKEDPTTR